MRQQILLLLSIIALLSPNAVRAGSAQAPSNALRVGGLKDRVTVHRDERGISYIEAASDRDLYFAQGYVTASDRLWQMDLLRRSARGELANYRKDRKSAESLLRIGESARDATMDPAELAAWTMVASAVLNLDETITKE